MKNKTALVTGATSGFGKAIALRLAKEGFRVIITGRRADRLTALKAELEGAFGIKVLSLSFDVRSQLATQEAIDSIPEDWKNIGLLVNNAGLALGREPFDEGVLHDWEQMLDTNVKGLIYVTREVVPLMKKQGEGMIVNIGSIAGKEAYPGGNVYSASKAAVDSLTKSLRIDLLPHGIRVGQIAPGAAETEFSLVRFKGNEEAASKVYQGFEPLHPEDIAEALWFMASRPDHVCINDMVIMPSAQASAIHLHKKSS